MGLDSYSQFRTSQYPTLRRYIVIGLAMSYPN